jgi:hypothetical protein
VNGLTLPYRSGVVEGHVNRVKILKRQMYDRAMFPLLRKRILCPNRAARSQRSRWSQFSVAADAIGSPFIAAHGLRPEGTAMAGQGLELLAQGLGTPDNLLTVLILTTAVAGIGTALTAILTRLVERRSRSESDLAERVFDRIARGRYSGVVRQSVRGNKHAWRAELREPEDVTPINRFAVQEAEIYLQHHRVALRHYSAYQQASLWSGLLGFALVLVGAVLTYSAGLDVGALTAAAGAVPAAAAGLLFRQANILSERAAENLRGLEDGVRRFNALQAALAATAEVDDPDVRNRMYERIGTQMLVPIEDPAAYVQEIRDQDENDDRSGAER